MLAHKDCASGLKTMSEIRSDLKGATPRSSGGDKALIWGGLIAISALAVVLWSQAGREVFASAMAGLWAFCF
jgi:hypothetical protein